MCILLLVAAQLECEWCQNPISRVSSDTHALLGACNGLVHQLSVGVCGGFGVHPVTRGGAANGGGDGVAAGPAGADRAGDRDAG
jgi:hypothetical protein